MKRKILFTLWLLLPVMAAAYHYGPGQQRLVLDEVTHVLSEAERAQKGEDWATAVVKYGEALDKLSDEKGLQAEVYPIVLAQSKARMLSRQTPEARDDLESLLEDMKADPASDGALMADVRSTLASAQLYTGYIMRLEGLAREEWEPEFEASRQNYRLLAEEAQKNGDAEAAAKSQKNLEGAIRLARMDLTELQGLPLPKECVGCKSCNSKGRKPAPPKKELNDARGAGMTPPPDGAGS